MLSTLAIFRRVLLVIASPLDHILYCLIRGLDPLLNHAGLKALCLLCKRMVASDIVVPY